MSGTETKYEIGQAEFQRALELLQQEQKYFAVAPWQRVLYRIYAVFFWVFVGGGLVALLAIVADMGKKNVIFGSDLSAVLTIGGLIMGFLGFLLMAVFIPFNLPLFIKIFRQWSKLKKLGFAGASRAMWKQESRHRRIAHWAARIAFWLGVLIIGAGLVSVIAVKEFGGGELFWFALFGSVLVFYAMLQSGKAFIEMIAGHVQELGSLQSSLVGLREQAASAGTERIAIPTAALEKLAQFDAVRIARDRANAIYDAQKATVTDFTVLLSSEAYQLKTSLQDEARLQVEDAVEQLMQNPTGSESRRDMQGRFHYAIAGTDLEFIYEVDQAQHRVLLLQIQRSPIAEGQHA